MNFEEGSVDELRVNQTALLIEIYEVISAVADEFLRAEYFFCVLFCIPFAAVIIGLVSWGRTPVDGALTALAFILGATTSMLSGYIGLE